MRSCKLLLYASVETVQFFTTQEQISCFGRTLTSYKFNVVRLDWSVKIFLFNFHLTSVYVSVQLFFFRLIPVLSSPFHVFLFVAIASSADCRQHSFRNSLPYRRWYGQNSDPQDHEVNGCNLRWWSSQAMQGMFVAFFNVYVCIVRV